MIDVDKIYCMDCIDGMKLLDDNSIDACVTDPPYGLGFMGKDWDKYDPTVNKGSFRIGTGTHPQVYIAIDKPAMQQFFYEWATEALRILKPGAHLLSFGGSRTYHRMACAIEDAGFEIRDQIMWVYGSGFPKSLNIGKAIDKLQGNEREIIDEKEQRNPYIGSDGIQFRDAPDYTGMKEIVTKGSSDWEGWGTALKPAHEPICMARKPLAEKTVAENVLKYGTGGINIDESRVDVADSEKESFAKEWDRFQSGSQEGTVGYVKQDGAYDLNQNRPLGRFPANFIHDGSDEVVELFPYTNGGSYPKLNKNFTGKSNITFRGPELREKAIKLDSGSASRFFYCAKASKKERDMGLEKTSVKKGELINRIEGSAGASWNDNYDTGNAFAGAGAPKHNNHPTVKPIALMEYLIKLVSREGATILDPFCGSGTTAIACKKLNRHFIGFEKEQEYVDIANKRLESIPIKLEVFE